jgi:peptide/nickel transport system permease protein
LIRYLIRRLLSAVAILAVVSVITYFLFFALPGDPARIDCGKVCPPARLAEIRHTLGLDQPIIVQYWDFMKGLFVGRDFPQAGQKVHCGVPCFGYSTVTHQPVWHTLLQRFPATISLALGAATLYLIVGVGFGALSALRAQSWLDRLGIGFTVLGSSLQIFVVGPILRHFLVEKWHVLPTPQYVPITQSPVEWFKGLLLPWFVLALVSMAFYARLTRAQMLETMGEDFIRAGRARGISSRLLHFKHTGRATLSPIVSVFGLDLAGLLSGAVITETVFNIQGLGRLSLTSVQQDDLSTIMAITLIGAVLILIANVIVDIVYSVIDPRVRVG